MDDNEAQRYATAKLLIHAENGKQTLNMSMGRPSLILLDVRLPDVDGVEVLKLLKQHEITRDVPIINYTS